jgi:hypothetical protein
VYWVRSPASTASIAKRSIFRTEFGILRQNEPMVVVTTVVSLVLYTLAQAPERVVSASLGVTGR